LDIYWGTLTFDYNQYYAAADGLYWKYGLRGEGADMKGEERGKRRGEERRGEKVGKNTYICTPSWPNGKWDFWEMFQSGSGALPQESY
jgi:hypothetical protein